MDSHIEWLLSTGMIRDVDANAVCQSLGLELRSRVLSPSDPRTQTPTAPIPQTTNITTSVQTSPILPSMPMLSLPPAPTAPRVKLQDRELQLVPSLVPAAQFRDDKSWLAPAGPQHYDISSESGRHITDEPFEQRALEGDFQSPPSRKELMRDVSSVPWAPAMPPPEQSRSATVVAGKPKLSHGSGAAEIWALWPASFCKYCFTATF